MYSALRGKAVDNCVQDALTRFAFAPGETAERVAIYSWPQRWSNSACGFAGGLAMQAFWVAPTLVVVATSNEICVYHAGRFAGYLRNSTPPLEAAMRDYNIPGQMDTKWWAEQAKTANTQEPTE